MQKGVYQRLVIQDGKVVGAILLGDTKMVRTLKKLIQSQRDVSGHEAELLESDFDLNDLVA
jgi:nitrite reductase (NADH) large subunit